MELEQADEILVTESSDEQAVEPACSSLCYYYGWTFEHNGH
jgi:hypothetical protein